LPVSAHWPHNIFLIDVHRIHPASKGDYNGNIAKEIYL
jgi:hypothetical protein